MNDKKLYLVKYECEDDPYCSHWYETCLMTHDKELAYSELHDRCKGKHIDSISDYDGFIEEYEYDNNIDKYILQKYIFASPSQISIHQLKYDADACEKVAELMHNDDKRSCSFKATLNEYVFDEPIHKEFDVCLEKIDKFSNPEGKFKFSLNIEGSASSSAMDCSENWWLDDDMNDNFAFFRKVQHYCIERIYPDNSNKLVNDFNAFIDDMVKNWNNNLRR